MSKYGHQTPAERSLQALQAAHTSWANTADRLARTAAAREAAALRFERQVDPDRVLPPEERHKRAENARRAHMLKMAAASAKARRLRRHAAAIEAELAGEDPDLIAGAERAAHVAGAAE